MDVAGDITAASAVVVAGLAVYTARKARVAVVKVEAVHEAVVNGSEGQGGL